MKLPRDVPGEHLASALEGFGYERLHQRGSHIQLRTLRHGEHHVTVPAHRNLKPGTLNHLLKQVAEHHGLTRDELINELRL